MQEETLFRLFEKYIRNQATEKEAIEFLMAVRSGEASILLQAYIKSFQELEPSSLIKDEMLEDVYKRIHDDIHRETLPSSPTNNMGHGSNNIKAPIPKRRLPIRYWKAAAVFLLLVLSAGLATYLLWQPLKHQKVARMAIQKPFIHNQDGAFRKLVQPGTYTRSLILEDHSSVVVRSGSSLDVNRDFNKSQRNVYLDGEAFFDVAHNDRKPFMIHTGSLTIEVLGTAFNVKAYSRQDSASIYVTRGKVLVRDSANKLDRVLNAHQSIVYQKNGASFRIEDQGEEDPGIPDWAAQDMVFDKLSLRQIFDRLSKRYKVTILSKDSRLLNTNVKISFVATESLQNVMEELSLITESQFQFQKDTVIVYRKLKSSGK